MNPACEPMYPSRQAALPRPAYGGSPLTSDLATNVLYYGDNLDILRRYLPDAAVNGYR